MNSENESLPADLRIAFARVIHELDAYIESSWQIISRNSWLKPDGSPVGDLDHAIEAHARSLVSTHLPNFEFIGEESVLPEERTGNYFFIDPVDGTENFVSGLPLWGTGIALMQNNQLVLSWVCFPEMNLEFASRQITDLIDCKRKRFRHSQMKTRIRAYSSNSDWSSVGPVLSGEIRVLGCSLLNITLAAHEAIDFKSSEKGARVWDILPPILFALEAGKRVLVNGEEYRGQFLDPNSRFVVEIQNS